MKKALLLAILLLLSVFVNAQEHLKFKGIPIDGSLNSFVNSLKSQGFILQDTEDGIAELTGTFAGYPHSTILVISTNNFVWKVCVLLPEQDTWNSAKQRYNDLKDSFRRKYGVTPICKETFPSYPDEGSGLEYQALKDESATWYSSFKIPSGYAELSITASFDHLRELQVMIEYFDAANSDRLDKAKMEDI